MPTYIGQKIEIDMPNISGAFDYDLKSVKSTNTDTDIVIMCDSQCSFCDSEFRDSVSDQSPALSQESFE